MRAQELWCMGLVAPWHAESSQSRDRTHILCTGRWILIHSITRAVQALSDWWQEIEKNTAQPCLCTTVTLDRLDGPEEEVLGQRTRYRVPLGKSFHLPKPSFCIHKSEFSFLPWHVTGLYVLLERWHIFIISRESGLEYGVNIKYLSWFGP